MITPRIQVKIYQHFLSDEIQHYTNYVNGVPEGRSFWWKKDGNLTKVSEGWGCQNIRLNEPTSFAGVAEEWKERATVNLEGIYLLFKHRRPPRCRCQNIRR